MYKRAAPPKKKFPRALVFLCIGVVAFGIIWFGSGIKHKASDARDTSSTSQNAATPSFDKTKHSLTDPLSQWVVVNKKRPLSPNNYEPTVAAPAIPLRSNKTAENMQLRPEMAAALETMVAAASAEGVQLQLASGYRSYQTQVSVYASEVKAYGKDQADQESARPGYSEHQTGWAADLSSVNGKCVIQACFALAPEGKWLAANAYKYGFIIRYPEGKTAVTGYTYEPWHVRFVGTDLSQEMHRTGIQTLEEFFSLSAAPSY